MADDFEGALTFIRPTLPPTLTPSFGETFGAAAGLSPYVQMMQRAREMANPPDPSYNPFDPDEIKGFEPYARAFVNVQSRAEAEALRSRIRSNEQRRRVVEEGSGWASFLSDTLLDPINLLPLPASRGLAVGRAALLGGTAVGAGTAVTEGLRLSSDPTAPFAESAANVMFSTLFGAALGGVGARLSAADTSRLAARLEADLNAMAGDAPPGGRPSSPSGPAAPSPAAGAASPAAGEARGVPSGAPREDMGVRPFEARATEGDAGLAPAFLGLERLPGWGGLSTFGSLISSGYRAVNDFAARAAGDFGLLTRANKLGRPTEESAFLASRMWSGMAADTLRELEAVWGRYISGDQGSKAGLLAQRAVDALRGSRPDGKMTFPEFREAIFRAHKPGGIDTDNPFVAEGARVIRGFFDRARDEGARTRFLRTQEGERRKFQDNHDRAIKLDGELRQLVAKGDLTENEKALRDVIARELTRLNGELQTAAEAGLRLDAELGEIIESINARAIERMNSARDAMEQLQASIFAQIDKDRAIRAKLEAREAERGLTPREKGYLELLKARLGERTEFDLKNLPSEIDGVEIVAGPTGKTRADGTPVLAYFSRDENRIRVDVEALAATWADKPWRDPKVPGVKPLDDALFPTPDAWVEFVIRHELAHTRAERPMGTGWIPYVGEAAPAPRGAAAPAKGEPAGTTLPGGKGLLATLSELPPPPPPPPPRTRGDVRETTLNDSAGTALSPGDRVQTISESGSANEWTVERIIETRRGPRVVVSGAGGKMTSFGADEIAARPDRLVRIGGAPPPRAATPSGPAIFEGGSLLRVIDGETKVENLTDARMQLTADMAAALKGGPLFVTLHDGTTLKVVGRKSREFVIDTGEPVPMGRILPGDVEAEQLRNIVIRRALSEKDDAAPYGGGGKPREMEVAAPAARPDDAPTAATGERRFSDADKAAYENRINEIAAAELRGGGPTDRQIDALTNLQRVADEPRSLKQREFLKDLLDRVNRSPIEFDGLKADPFYLPRHFRRDRIAADSEGFKAVIARYYGDEVAETVTANLLKGWDPNTGFVPSGYAENWGGGGGRFLLSRKLDDIPNAELLPWIETDVAPVLRGYAQRFGTGVEFARAFGDRKAEAAIADVLMQVARESKAGDARAIMAEIDKLAGDMRFVRDSTLGDVNDPMLVNQRGLAATARNYTSLTALGGAGISAMAEAAKPLMMHGFGRVFGFAFNGLALSLDRLGTVSRELKRLTGEASDVVMGTTLNRVMEGGFAERSTNRFLDRANRFAEGPWYILNGLAPVTDVLKTWNLVMANQFMLEDALAVAAGKASQKTIERLAGYGLSKVDAEAISRMPLDRNGTLWLPNISAWSDEGLARRYAGAVAGVTRRAVVTAAPADGPDIARGFVGSGRREMPLVTLPFQFMQFMFAATNKTLVSALQGRDANVMLGILPMVGMGMIATWAKTDGSAWERMPFEEKLLRAIDASGVLPLISDLNTMAENISQGTIGVRPALGLAGRNRDPDMFDSVGELAGPFVSKTLDILKLFVDGDTDGGDVARTIRRSLPFNNLFYVRDLFRDAERAAGWAMD